MRCPKHCKDLVKYGRVGVYWLGLGLCRESAVGNKTIAMNCLRIMLGINPPPAHTQTIQSNENPFLLKPFSSCQSRSSTFSSLEAKVASKHVSYLWVISWAISISWWWVLCECRGVMCASDVRRITCYHSPGLSLPHPPSSLRQTNNSKANVAKHSVLSTWTPPA